MKKIAIVTWIRGCNYGTMLQAYALSDMLDKSGFDVTLLDDSKLDRVFNNTSGEGRSVAVSFKQDGRAVYLLKKVKKAIGVILIPQKRREYRNKRVFEQASQKKLQAFQTFKKEFLKRSQPIRLDELERIGKEYDAYICGSDQIWTYRSAAAANYYYLGFTADEKKRIAYAPCAGEKTFSPESVPVLQRLVQRFASISIRDEHTAELIKSLWKADVPIVSDPVLLKTKEEWISDFSLKKRNAKYLLCYILGKHKWYEEKIKWISKRLELPIRWIPVNPEQSDFLKSNEAPCGPCEFVELFYNATFVCTDSYHGTLFSLIFEKQFVNLERYSDEENSQNERFYSIYRRLNLPNILLRKADSPNGIPQISYDSIREKIRQFREESYMFLLNSLEVVK